MKVRHVFIVLNDQLVQIREIIAEDESGKTTVGYFDSNANRLNITKRDIFKSRKAYENYVKYYQACLKGTKRTLKNEGCFRIIESKYLKEENE